VDSSFHVFSWIFFIHISRFGAILSKAFQQTQKSVKANLDIHTMSVIYLEFNKQIGGILIMRNRETDDYDSKQLKNEIQARKEHLEKDTLWWF